MIARAVYTSIDGCRKTKKYKTKKGLVNFIDEWVGLYVSDGKDGEALPKEGTRISFDGVGRVQWKCVD